MPNYLCEAGGILSGGFPWSIRMYMVSSDTESTAETTWHASITDMWGSTGLNALIPSATELTYTYTSTMSAAWKQTTKTQTNATLAGGGTGAMPYHVAEVVTWRSAQATKYGRGRWYLPGLIPGALAAGGYFLSTTATGDIVTAVNAAITAWGSTLQPVILHRKATKSGPGALTTDNIIAGDIPDQLAVQRRRADKRVPIRTSLTF